MQYLFFLFLAFLSIETLWGAPPPVPGDEGAAVASSSSRPNATVFSYNMQDPKEEILRCLEIGLAIPHRDSSDGDVRALAEAAARFLLVFDVDEKRRMHVRAPLQLRLRSFGTEAYEAMKERVEGLLFWGMGGLKVDDDGMVKWPHAFEGVGLKYFLSGYGDFFDPSFFSRELRDVFDVLNRARQHAEGYEKERCAREASLQDWNDSFSAPQEMAEVFIKIAFLSGDNAAFFEPVTAAFEAHRLPIDDSAHDDAEEESFERKAGDDIPLLFAEALKQDIWSGMQKETASYVLIAKELSDKMQQLRSSNAQFYREVRALEEALASLDDEEENAPIATGAGEHSNKEAHFLAIEESFQKQIKETIDLAYMIFMHAQRHLFFFQQEVAPLILRIDSSSLVCFDDLREAFWGIMHQRFPSLHKPAARRFPPQEAGAAASSRAPSFE